MPLPHYHLPGPKLLRYPTSAPPCDARDLLLGNGRTGAGLGNDLEEFVVTNAGSSPCLLRGYPTVSARTAAGRRARLHPRRGGTYFGTLIASDISPGGHVYLDLATSSGCAGGRAPIVRYHALRLSLPGGGVLINRSTRLSVQCGLSISPFGLPERIVQPVAAPGSAGTLTARLAVPRTVRAGSVLHFTVALLDPTGTPVSLVRCPGYTEAMDSARATFRRSFRLDCAPVRAIASHARVRFAMELEVPAEARGASKLSWSLDTATGPFAGTVVEVTR